MGKLSKIILSMILVVAIFSIFVTYTSNMVVSYNKQLPQEYNETFQVMSSMKNISDQVLVFKQESFNENKSTNPITQFIDIIGRYYERGFKTVELVPQMLNLFDTMAQYIIGANINILGIAFNPIMFLAITGFTLIVIVLFVSVLLRYEL